MNQTLYDQKENLLVFIDAKYKSNLYNKFDNSETLKDDHRHDLHQIMAYSSFSKTDFKYGFLCYPSDQLELKAIKYKNGINEVTNTVIVMGIPLKKSTVNDAKRMLISELNEIEKRTTVPNIGITNNGSAGGYVPKGMSPKQIKGIS